MEKSKCKSIPFHVLMNPCNLIKIAKFIVRRDTESQDIFILYFQRTNNFYVLLLEPTSTFLWISIVWLNIMPYKENDNNNILDCEKKKKTKLWENVLRFDQVSKELKLKTMACISSLCFLSKQFSEIYKQDYKTISLLCIHIYMSIWSTRFYMQVPFPINLSCFSLVTCL